MSDMIRRLKSCPKLWNVPLPFTPSPLRPVERECIAHALQAITDLDDRATVLSIDGIGAFDLISRGAMLDGLRSVAGGDSALPFDLQFYGNPSSYLWENDRETHETMQGEGGEQGVPLMPCSTVWGNTTFRSVQSQLPPDERLLVFHDNIHVVSQPERTVEIHDILREDLCGCSRNQIHAGKTQIWNRGRHIPTNHDTPAGCPG